MTIRPVNGQGEQRVLVEEGDIFVGYIEFEDGILLSGPGRASGREEEPAGRAFS